MVYSEWANMCLRLAIKSVSAFTRHHSVVAVVFGSVIVTGSEATQKCFCEISAPHNPVVQSGRKAPLPCSAEGNFWFGCCGPLGRAARGLGVAQRGGSLSPSPHCIIWFISAWWSFVALCKWLRERGETIWIPPAGALRASLKNSAALLGSPI